MPVRLNITIDQDVYDRLKGELPPKGISRFIIAIKYSEVYLF